MAAEPEVEQSVDEAPDDVPLVEPPEAATETAAVDEPVDVAIQVEPADDADPRAEEARLAALRRRGRLAYERHCESCHDEGPRLLGRDLAATAIRRQVRAGGRRMRAIPPERLGERDLRAICAFLARS